MTDEYKLVSLLITGVTVVLLAMVSCTMHGDYRISQDIRSGVHPIAAQCAHALNVDRSACIQMAVEGE